MSAMGVHDEMSRRSSTHGFRTPQMPRFTGFTPLPPIADNGVEYMSEPTGPAVDYEATPIETVYKLHSKDSCFATAVSSDTKHAVFLSPHSFQVFAIPTPEQTPQLKPRFHYRLGDWEGLKKSKVRWQYKAAAISDRYVVTITKERLQVHDLADECKVIYNDAIRGWEYTCVSIAANKLAVGLSRSVRGGETIGLLRLYRLNATTFDGHRYERFGKDLHLPIHPQHPQDAPHLINLSKDGTHLTCATPRCGYYFAWDISHVAAPRHLSTSQLRKISGRDAERLTSITLFPDKRHMLCTTTAAAAGKQNEILAAGCFTEAMYPGISGTPSQRQLRQITSFRITASAISPNGEACAFLSKNGTVWITPLVLLDGDDNLTSFATGMAKERLLAGLEDRPIALAFSPRGERLVGVDRKGKLLVVGFPLRPEAPDLSPPWLRKTEVGGYY